MPERGPALAVGEPEHRYTELMLRAGEILASALDWRETVHAVCDAVVDTIADFCFLYLTDDAGNLYLAASSSAGAEHRSALEEVQTFLRKSTRRAPITWEVAKNAKPVFLPHLDEEIIRSIAMSDEHEQFMHRMHYRSVIAIPVITKTRGVIGALGVVRTDRTPEPFDERAMRFLEDLAHRFAAVIGKALMYEQTLRIATVFQKAALPTRLPDVDGITFDAVYEPSSEDLLVGGDWYDAFTLPDGRVAITLGDVLGHGLEAAVWMSRLRNGFRASLLGDPNPARALEIVDVMLQADSNDDFFTTALVALVDPGRQILTCSSAGHPGPLVWNGAGDAIDPFIERGLPLGMRHFRPAPQVSQTLHVRPGSFAVFFTDGLLEWNRDIGSCWEALQDAVRLRHVREARHPARELRNAVIEGDHHQDDVAILTVRWDGRLARTPVEHV